jgi:hypothetical protein
MPNAKGQNTNLIDSRAIPDFRRPGQEFPLTELIAHNHPDWTGQDAFLQIKLTSLAACAG